MTQKGVPGRIGLYQAAASVQNTSRAGHQVENQVEFILRIASHIYAPIRPSFSEGVKVVLNKISHLLPITINTKNTCVKLTDKDNTEVRGLLRKGLRSSQRQNQVSFWKPAGLKNLEEGGVISRRSRVSNPHHPEMLRYAPA